MLLLCWMNATFTTHPLIPLPFTLWSVSCFSCAPSVVCTTPVSQADWTQSGWRVVALSSCCCSYITPRDHSAADELDQRSATTDNWLLQKNCVQGLVPTQGKGWKQEERTGWHLGLTFHSITQSNWLNLIAKLQRNWDMWNDPFQKHPQICSFFFPHWPTLQQLHKQLHQHKDVLNCGTKICRHKATV